MPRQQVRAPSARIASQMKTRGRGGSTAAASSSRSASAGGSSSSLGSSSPRASRASPPVGRQLRSRTVPVAAGAGSGNTEVARARAASARPIRVRRRSRSAASSRASEAETCTTATAAASGRPAPRQPAKRRAPVPVIQTRATARTKRSARMSIGGLNPRRQHVGQEQQQPPRTSAATPRKLAAAKTARNSRVLLAARNTQHESSNRNLGVNCQVTAGCHVRLDPLAMEKHFLQCRPRTPCPLAPIENCKWEGASSRAKSHIMKEHHQAVVCKTGPNGLISLSDWRRPAPLQWHAIQTSLGQDFLIIVKKYCNDQRHTLFSGLVSMFGEQEANDRFEFRMTLKSHGTPNRLFSYSSVVGALPNANSVLKKGDCFSFDSAYAELFSKDDNNLEVEFSISFT